MFRQQGPGVGGVVPYQPHVQQVQIKTRGHDAGGKEKKKEKTEKQQPPPQRKRSKK